MTNQEIFDKAWRHFVVEQAPPGVSIKGGCRYRGEGGTKCALGLLIPDDEYVRTMEMRPFREVALNLKTPIIITNDQWRFLMGLQHAHDTTASDFRRGRCLWTSEIERRLRSVAKEFELTIPAEAA